MLRWMVGRGASCSVTGVTGVGATWTGAAGVEAGAGAAAGTGAAAWGAGGAATGPGLHGATTFIGVVMGAATGRATRKGLPHPMPGQGGSEPAAAGSTHPREPQSGARQMRVCL